MAWSYPTVCLHSPNSVETPKTDKKPDNRINISRRRKRNGILKTPEDHEHGILKSSFAIERAKLVRMANRVLRCQEEAEDVVQDTFLNMCRLVKENRDIGKFEAYLSRAVYWNALKRKACRKAHISLDGMQEPAAQSLEPSIDHMRLDALELERAIEELPVTQQAVIRLRFYVGLSFKEIGRNLSISINTAASRTRYALNTLRRKLRLPQKVQIKETEHE